MKRVLVHRAEYHRYSCVSLQAYMICDGVADGRIQGPYINRVVLGKLLIATPIGMMRYRFNISLEWQSVETESDRSHITRQRLSLNTNLNCQSDKLSFGIDSS